MSLSSLLQAIEVLGSQTAVAAVVRRTPQAVSDLIKRGGAVPAEWCIPLEAATEAKGQRIPRAAFRPDIYPGESSDHACTVKPAPASRQRVSPAAKHAPRRRNAWQGEVA